MKKTTVIIIHGSYGRPDENWFPWLAQELQQDGIEVKIPTFPTPEGQSLASWEKAFKEQIGSFSEDTIFVGHSLGPAFILTLVEKSAVPILGCFFASGFLGALGNDDFDVINSTFMDKVFDWETIRNNAGQVHLYHGADDPYVPLSLAKEFADHFYKHPHVIPQGGHLNASSGFNTFPKLLKDIRKLITTKSPEYNGDFAS